MVIRMRTAIRTPNDQVFLLNKHMLILSLSVMPYKSIKVLYMKFTIILGSWKHGTIPEINGTPQDKHLARAFVFPIELFPCTGLFITYIFVDYLLPLATINQCTSKSNILYDFCYSHLNLLYNWKDLCLMYNSKVAIPCQGQTLLSQPINVFLHVFFDALGMKLVRIYTMQLYIIAITPPYMATQTHLAMAINTL